MICRLELLPAFLTVDFTNVDHIMGIPLKYKGLDVPPANISVGGVKYKHTLYLPDTDDFGDQKGQRAVEFLFEDIMKDGHIDYIKKTSNYYGINDQGEEILFCSKIDNEIVRDSQALIRKRYDRAYTHLKKSAEGTPVEGYVNTILTHYAAEVSLWLLGNPDPFLDAISAETDANINALLDIVVHESGKKVRDGIVEQLTGTAWSPQS